MPKYEVRLDSTTDKQYKLLTVHDAKDAKEARAIAEAKELHVAEFSLLPPEEDVWQVGGPRQVDLADGDAVVDHSRWDAHHLAFARALQGLPYEEHVAAARHRLGGLSAAVQFDRHGQVVQHSLTPRALARYVAHLQQEPYTVSDVREIPDSEIDTVRLVRQLAAASTDEKAWKKAIDALQEAGIAVAAVTAQIHGVAALKNDDGSGPIIWGSDSIFNALLTGYTANPDTHAHWSDAVASEVTGTGYTANGQALASKTSQYVTATNQTQLDAADSAWTSSTISATDSAIVDRTPATDATRPLYGSVDFGGTVSTTNGTFTETWDATGIIVRTY